MTDMTQNIIIAKIIIKIKMAVKGYQGGSEVLVKNSHSCLHEGTRLSFSSFTSTADNGSTFDSKIWTSDTVS